jgi:chromosome segregation ATPase
MAWVKIKLDNNDLLMDLDALDESIRHQLSKAEHTLNRLFCQREKLIRSINKGRWDAQQYALDDLQQKLADISEELAEIGPVESILHNLIAE